MNSKKQQPYRAVIIGAGRIASGFDTPSSRRVLTHAHALVNHPRMQLSGMTDIDTARGKKEARKWKTDFFDSLDCMLMDVVPDLVVIATPDVTHADLLERVTLINPRLIICEKPVVASAKEMLRIRKVVLPKRIPTLINFSRRFDPVVQDVRQRLMSGEYGRIVSANGVYTNGVLHNGSHMIDLARFLFGGVLSTKGIFTVSDHKDGKPSVGGIATFERCPQFYLMSADERNYAVFELEIFTERKRLRFSNFGLELTTQEAVPDPIFKGFRALSQPSRIKTDLLNALPNLIEHAIHVLDGEDEPLSSLDEGLKTQEACFQLLKGATKK